LRDSSGQHPGVDLVGLAGQGRQSLHLLGVGDVDVPAVQLQGVVDETGSGHRLDDGVDRSTVGGKAPDQALEAVGVGGDGGDGYPLAALIERTDVQPLSA
jgi:hypothetical protein